MSALTQLGPRRGNSQDLPVRSRRGPAEDREESRVPHCTLEGKRPTNTILLDRLTPEALGKLVALYEHSVFTQGTVCGASTSSTHGGVELGKCSPMGSRVIS
jgi:glucose-6-phosphate isomerase